MNVLKATHHVVLTQSAETCQGGISAIVCLVSLLPLEITGTQESQVISPVQVMRSGSQAWVFGGQLLLSWVPVFLTIDT